MDDGFPVERDEGIRFFACQLVENMADRAASNGQFMLQDTASFIDAAQQIEFYITNGQDVAFVCNEGSEKFVR